MFVGWRLHVYSVATDPQNSAVSLSKVGGLLTEVVRLNLYVNFNLLNVFLNSKPRLIYKQEHWIVFLVITSELNIFWTVCKLLVYITTFLLYKTQNFLLEIFVLNKTLKGIKAVYDSITERFFVHQILGQNIWTNFLSFYNKCIQKKTNYFVLLSLNTNVL